MRFLNYFFGVTSLLFLDCPPVAPEACDGAPASYIGAPGEGPTTQCYVDGEDNYVHCKPQLLCAYIRRYKNKYWGKQEVRTGIGCAVEDEDIKPGACQPYSAAKPWETVCFCRGSFCNGVSKAKPSLFIVIICSTGLLWKMLL